MDATKTGVLSDEYQEVSDGRPVLIEDETSRVYRSNDLPPNTRVVISDKNRLTDPVIEKARRAGFEVIENL